MTARGSFQWVLLAVAVCCLAVMGCLSPGRALPQAKRILFLGDSITHSGQYVEFIEAALITTHPKRVFEIINCGLPSETVSGLSEPGHAGGQFPRPDLHERLDRVLTKVKPDLVVICYGMNDGIYMPLSEERFAAFRHGMNRLHDKAVAAGARVIHLTPALFDVEPIRARTDRSGEPGKTFTDYDAVLEGYGQWLLAQGQASGWTVLDVHGAMKSAVVAGRVADPKFTFAGDGVHPNDAGHKVMAQPILDLWKVRAKAGETNGVAGEVLKLVRTKQRLLRDAWLRETGHQRPGLPKGLPLAEAQEKAADVDRQARSLMSPDRASK